MQVEHATPAPPTEEADITTAEVEPENVRVVAIDPRRERRGVTRQLLERSFRPAEIAEADSRAEAVELVLRGEIRGLSSVGLILKANEHLRRGEQSGGAVAAALRGLRRQRGLHSRSNSPRRENSRHGSGWRHAVAYRGA